MLACIDNVSTPTYSARLESNGIRGVPCPQTPKA
jgi:hypothetical protein